MKFYHGNNYPNLPLEIIMPKRLKYNKIFIIIWEVYSLLKIRVKNKTKRNAIIFKKRNNILMQIIFKNILVDLFNSNNKINY